MKRLLLIHADPKATKMIKTVLLKHQYDIKIANTRQQAIEKVTNEPVFDLTIVGSRIYDWETLEDRILGDTLIHLLLQIKSFEFARMACEPENIRSQRGHFVYDLFEGYGGLVVQINNYFANT